MKLTEFRQRHVADAVQFAFILSIYKVENIWRLGYCILRWNSSFIKILLIQLQTMWSFCFACFSCVISIAMYPPCLTPHHSRYVVCNSIHSQYLMNSNFFGVWIFKNRKELRQYCTKSTRMQEAFKWYFHQLYLDNHIFQGWKQGMLFTKLMIELSF